MKFSPLLLFFGIVLFAAMDAHATSWIDTGNDGLDEFMSAPVVTSSVNGEVYLGYKNNSISSTRDAIVKKYNGVTWDTVGTGGFSAGSIQNINIAIDGDNVLYAVYEDGEFSSKATVQKFNGTSWEVVGSEGFTSEGVSNPKLAFDSDGAPYVTYQWGGAAVYVDKFTDGTWSAVGGQVSASEGDRPQIAIDDNDAIYVAYQDEQFGINPEHVTVKKFNGVTWDVVGTEAFNDGDADSIRLAIDSSQVPYVAYYDQENENRLIVQKFTGGTWNAVGGIAAQDVYSVDFIITENDDLFLAYTTGNVHNNLRVKKYTGSTWSDYGNIAEESSTYYQSLAISENTLYLAYARDLTSKVKMLSQAILSNTPIYRLYNTKSGVHLYTRGEGDRDKVLAKWKDFEFTDGSPAFYASITDDGKTPIYRLYNKRTGVHLYTRGEADKNKVLAKWKDFEFTDGAPAFYASLTPVTDTTPIYRLYNKRSGVHLYTRGETDKNKILAKFSDFEFTDGAPAFYLRLQQ